MSIFDKIRREAAEKEQARNKSADGSENPMEAESHLQRQVAEKIGRSQEEVAYCCGSTCPSCDVFLDKAMALEELGHKHHLFLNPVQWEIFEKALALYRTDRAEYERQKPEIITALRS